VPTDAALDRGAASGAPPQAGAGGPYRGRPLAPSSITGRSLSAHERGRHRVWACPGPGQVNRRPSSSRRNL